ncbi:MAG: hypothetical protein ACRDJE_28795 [Dehalococcoidia bacterium]
MNGWRLVSARFPYVSLRLTLGGLSEQLDALLDTGFDGDVVVPAGYPIQGLPQAKHIPAHLADGTEILIPAYSGVARIGEIEIAPVSVLTVGDVALVGTNLIKHFTVILDHGQRVIVEP